MFDFGLYNVFIIAGVLAVQYFFSTRNHVAWGAIIPIVYIGYMIWLFVTNRIGNALEFILILLLGLAFLIGNWNGGRKSLQQKRKEELQKMQTYDMT